MLLFNDNAANDSIFEDLCYLLKDGITPNLYTNEEKIKLSELCKFSKFELTALNKDVNNLSTMKFDEKWLNFFSVIIYLFNKSI